MDFSKFDNRGPAETGQRMEVRDPAVIDGEVVMNGDHTCAVIVRGTTARSVQTEIRKRQKAKMAKGKADETRTMEDIHNDLCDAATPLIVGFEHIERDGRPLTAEPDDVKWFLDLTFPVMGAKKDEDGNTVLSEKGDVQFEMKNNPFAKQVVDHSSEQALQAGNAQGA